MGREPLFNLIAMKNTPYHLHINLAIVALLFIGLLLRYWIGKRRFNRRNIAGLQQFKNYRQAVCASIIEKGINILGLLMLLAAIILYLIK